MSLTVTDELIELKFELRQYFDQLLTSDVLRGLHEEGEVGGPVRDAIMRQIGSDGWFGIGWPEEYGGQNRGEAAQYIFYSEAYRAQAPLPMVTLTTVAPTIMSHGSQAQKDYFLPKILAGELVFSIGYTEPEAGTDLASLRTTARAEGKELVINGSKVFTSGALGADWIWLAVRTDPEAQRHKGISLVLVPTNSDGFSATAIDAVGGVGTTATYYDDVRIPTSNVVGGMNQGWNLITTQLNHERVGLAAYSGICEGMLEETVEWLSQKYLPDGTAYASQPGVTAGLGRAWALNSAMSLMNWRLVESAETGNIHPGEASAAKVFATEAAIDIYRLLLEIVGTDALHIHEVPRSIHDGRLALMNLSAQINTFGGGVAEIQREIVAWTLLGMKRGER